MVRALPRVSLVVLVLALAGGCKPPESAKSPEPAANGSASANPDGPPPVIDDGMPPALPPLKKEVLTPGTGPEVKKGDRLSMHYTGTLTNGTKFDSSLDRGQPFEFQVGKGQVIVGWELGCIGMQKGGKYRLTIPPHIGYGSTGSPPKIPPEATLVFEIELLEILPPE